MSKEIDEIKNRLANLERAFLMSQKNNINVTTNADKIISMEPEVSDLRTDVNTNTSDIYDSQMGLAQTYELGVSNSQDLLYVELAIAELYELIGPEL